MKIKFIGVGAALNTSNIGSSILIDDSILIDAPLACSPLLLRDGIDVKKINHILISHLHGDHYFGLPFLLLEYMLTKRENPLHVYGSESLRYNTIELLRLAFPESDPEQMISSSESTFTTLSLENSITADHLEITPVKSKHAIETFGFLIKSLTKTIYYSSDTEFTEEVQRSIEAADSIIIDGTTRGMALSGHTDLNKVIESAKKYKDKTFYISHRSQYSFEDVQIENVIFPKDGEEFAV